MTVLMERIVASPSPWEVLLADLQDIGARPQSSNDREDNAPRGCKDMPSCGSSSQAVRPRHDQEDRARTETPMVKTPAFLAIYWR